MRCDGWVQRDARLRQEQEPLVARLLQGHPQQQLQRDCQVGGAPAALRVTHSLCEQLTAIGSLRNTILDAKYYAASRFENERS